MDNGKLSIYRTKGETSLVTVDVLTMIAWIFVKELGQELKAIN